MSKKKVFYIALPIVAALFIGAWVLSFTTTSNLAIGSALSGMASHATSSTIAVGPQEDKTLFTKNSDCAARVVSTTGAIAYLSFHSSINPDTLIGFSQPASTTKEYDSEIYGCGAVTASAAASTTITKMETSQ